MPSAAEHGKTYVQTTNILPSQSVAQLKKRGLADWNHISRPRYWFVCADSLQSHDGIELGSL
jgi:hypothetical protein